MAEQRIQRRLAAILAADVVGYSRLMEADEAGTLERLKALRREIFAPKARERGGRIFKTTGDGALVEFKSATDAVDSAVAIQAAVGALNDGVPTERRIDLRIGISLGDVIVEGIDLYGNGVNVAARMEGLAEPGGICVSANVYEHIHSASGLAFDDLGERQVKNLDRPVACYRVRIGQSAERRVPAAGRGERPGIAVLPFDNMSGDPEQEHFSDGISEDIITALSRVRAFAVIARNTTFTYKGRAVDVAAVARELGVRYVLEGSVRKAGNRVRITTQLIDGETGSHIWSERYDRELEDIFAVQDEITITVVGAIAPQLAVAERNHAMTAQPDNLTVWELYHQGLNFLDYQSTFGDADDLMRAAERFKAAISIDKEFPRAWIGLARCYYAAILLGAKSTKLNDIDAAMVNALHAVELDPQDSAGHWILGGIHLLKRDIDVAIQEERAAIELNPSDAMAYQVLGLALISSGDAAAAQIATETAIRISPRDPQSWVRRHHLGFARLH